MFKLDYTSTQNHSAVVDVTLAPGHMSVGELKHTVFRPSLRMRFSDQLTALALYNRSE